MSVDTYRKELSLQAGEWTDLASTMLCQLHSNREFELVARTLNKIFGNCEYLVMGPIVDRDLLGFQHLTPKLCEGRYRLTTTGNYGQRL